MACPHHWTGLFRFPMRDGRWQVREMCLDCRRNVRPKQPHIPYSEAGDWMKLPVWDEAVDVGWMKLPTEDDAAESGEEPDGRLF